MEYSAFNSGVERLTDTTRGLSQFVDKKQLIHSLMRAAVGRRCDVDLRPRQEPARREVCLASFNTVGVLADQVCSQVTTEDIRRNRTIGEKDWVRCCVRIPWVGHFGSKTASQDHLRAGTHHQRSGSREVSNQRDRPEEQGSMPEIWDVGARNTTGNRSSPSVDLVQWAQTLTGTSPAFFSVDMI